MQKIIYKLILVFVLLPFLALSQGVVSGRVSDEAGPLPGASVYEKDVPTNGVATDIDGKFSIKLRGTSNILVIQSIGLLSQEINVKGKSNLTIMLEPDSKGLEEVVVVGFGVQKKLTNTGAISTISAAEIRQNPSASVQNALAGRLPGFFSQQRSGQPGADGALFYIRGVSTYAGSSQPLIIVDDVEYEYDKVSDLDPNEIESISILKDASTTAIYGIKGANGVLIITTKRGVAGKPRINFKTEAGFQFDVDRPEFLSSYDALRLKNETLINNGEDTTVAIANGIYTPYGELLKYKNNVDPYAYPNVDWWGEIFKKGSMLTRNNLDFQGGSKSVKYFVSTGYLWQNGSLRNFNKENEVNNNYYYKRYNFRSNIDVAATRTLDLRLDLSGRFDETNEPFGLSSSRYANGNGIVGEIYSGNYLTPYGNPVLNPDGSYPVNPSNNNPSIIGRIGESGYSRKFDNDLSIVASANQDLDFLTDGLSAKALVSYTSSQDYSVSASREVAGIPFYTYNPETGAYIPLNADVYRKALYSSGYSSGTMFRTINARTSLNYDRTFAKHRIYSLALFNDSRLIDQKTVKDKDQGPGVPTVTTGLTLRLGYDFDNKYLLEFNAAYNGTDRFEGNKRYGWFPAVSLGWNIAEEKFFSENISFMELFKIRGSYGVVGSDDIGGARKYLQLYRQSGNYYFGGFDSPSATPIINEGDLGNLNVTWEKEKKLDLGVDLSFFDGKIKFTGDYFANERYDILTERKSVPNTLGVGLPKINLGIVQNRGFDLELAYNQRFENDFNMNFRLTYSHAKNKIIFQDEAQPAYPWLAATGNPIGQQFGWTWIGFYSQEDIDNPDVAKPISNKIGPGDLKYLDLNDDKIIDESDKGAIGHPNLPSETYGLNFNFGYKGLSFNMFFQGAYNYSQRFNSETIIPGSSNYQPVHLGRWTPETAATATFPRLGGGAPTNYPGGLANASTFWTRDSYYIRFKNAEISYLLPNKFVKRLKLSAVRVFTNANNLITWTNITDLYQVDPENGNSTSTVQRVYPTQRIYNLGLNVTF